MSYEQFLNSNDLIKSLNIIRQYVIEEIKVLCSELKLEEPTDFNNYVIPTLIKQDNAYKYLSLKFACETVSIIDEKLKI